MLELASVNDKMVQAIKTSPPAFSLSKKSLNNFVALIDNVCLLNVCRVSVRVAGNGKRLCEGGAKKNETFC